jgi:predicted nucleic acid-binding protein
MRTMFDSSVLIAALVDGHPFHTRARPWLERAGTASLTLHVAAHSLCEVYSGLTRIPFTPRISPAAAIAAIDQALAKATIVALSVTEYWSVVRRMAQLGIVGGAIYDALIARAAEKARVERLLTFNQEHFVRVWPEGADRIQVP